MKLKITSLSIQSIPLIHKKGMHCCIKNICKTLQLLSCCHWLCSITPSHFAIELKLENDYTIIIEYGQYYSEDSKKNDASKFASSKDRLLGSQNCREETIDLSYYYIDGDGVRITILNKDIKEVINENLFYINNLKEISSFIKDSSLLITAYQYYLLPVSLLLANKKSQEM